MVPKAGTIRDLLTGLQQKANINDETTKNIRMYETHNNKIHKLWHEESSVQGISDFVSLYAEVASEDELKMAPNERLITVFHFDKEASKTHGVPFRFVVKPVSDPLL